MCNIEIANLSVISDIICITVKCDYNIIHIILELEIGESKV